MLNKNRFNNKVSYYSGLSLIEILVSILLLGIVASFVAVSIPTSVGLSNRTDDMENTTVMAQKYIEDVKAQFELNPGLFDTVENGTTPPIDIDDEHIGYGEYSLTTNIIVDNNYEGLPCLFTLEVTVAPKAGDEVLSDSDQTVTVSSMLRRTR